MTVLFKNKIKHLDLKKQKNLDLKFLAIANKKQIITENVSIN